MNTAFDRSPRHAMWLVVGGILTLATAIGVGRFAFTPLMPLMMRDGTLTAAVGAEWAASNYVGYLVGALTAAWFSSRLREGIAFSLMGVTLTTVAVVWTGGESGVLAGALLRAAAGVFSAWALVCASSWFLRKLAAHHAPQLGAWIYTGVGLGIALTGTLAWLGGRQSASWLWIELAIIALVATTAVGLILRDGGTVSSSTAVAAVATGAAPERAHGQLGIIVCYGAFGFGYIIPATFLPAMAQQLVSDPLVFGLTWPLFGLAAVSSVAVAARWLAHWPRRRVWAFAQGAMAVGTAFPLIGQSLWTLSASAVLVGGTFMVATMAGLQLAREQAPANPTPLQGWMTAAFAAGQILGPLLVRALGPDRVGGWGALDWANATATLVLALTALWLWLAREPSAAR